MFFVIVFQAGAEITGRGRGSGFVIVEDSVLVYALPSVDSKPVKIIDRGSLVTIVANDTVAGMVRVKVLQEEVGWVLSKAVARNNNQLLYLEELKVMGYLDNPDPIYIFEAGIDTEWTPIRVDRNFVMDPVLNRNLNKENFEWENEIYYYKGSAFKPEAVKGSNKR